jgi:hypothetical protein
MTAVGKSDGGGIGGLSTRRWDDYIGDSHAAVFVRAAQLPAADTVVYDAVIIVMS